MEIVVIMVLLLVVVVALVLRLVSRGKRSTTTPGPLIDPLVSKPRYKDGAVTYRQFGLDGNRLGLRVENPYASHPARYERRHHRKKHAPTKPWVK